MLKAAATRRGVAEAELLREAIHLVALAERQWSEPFFSQVYERHDEPALDARDALADALADAWSDKAADYERSREVRR